MLAAVHTPQINPESFIRHGIRATMLLSARDENPAFADVPVTECECKIKIEDPVAPTVLLTLTHGKLEHNVVVHLRNSWIGRTPLDDLQVEALKTATGFAEVQPIRFGLLSQAQLPREEVDRIPIHELYERINSTPGRGEIHGTLCLEDDGPAMHLHLYFAAGSTQVVTHAYGKVSPAGTSFALAAEHPEIGGYKVIVGANYTCRHFPDVTPEQAKAIHERVVQTFDRRGLFEAARALKNETFADILEEGCCRGELFSLEEVRAFGFEPLDMTTQEIGRDLGAPACVADVYGFAIDEDSGKYFYHDFMMWRPEAGNQFRVVRTQAVLFHEEAGECELSDSPQDTEGYAMRIGTFGDPVVFVGASAEDMRRIHAAVCQSLIDTGSTIEALKIACRLGGAHPNPRVNED